MLGFNHVAGGLAFSGIFASFSDVNMFEKPEYIAVTVFGSLLADVDHTRSPIGKLFYPLAKWIDKKYGHRTITHSLLFYLVLVAAVAVFEMLFTGSKVLTMFFALSYGSHLLFDMCTRQGIPLFMPFSRARCVLPGNPNLRLSSQSYTSEIAVFFVFIGLLFTTMPLMANGFWTTYNKAFATFAHMHRENTTSPDILEAVTTGGTSGNVVSTSNTGAIIYAGGRFIHLEQGKYSLKAFSHTGSPRRSARIEFEGIAPDSMRKILAQPIIKLQAVSTLPIRYKLAGMQYEKQSLDLEYSTGFSFIVIEPDNSGVLEQVARQQAILIEKQSILEAWKAEQAQTRKRLAELTASFDDMSEYEQGKAIESIARLRQDIENAKQPDITPAIVAATNEIARLRQANGSIQAQFTGVVEIWKQ